ncbi:MAG: DNA repair protein RadA [Chlorobi bacterium]|nr:MAG: DNA repair protein RadA [Chlorobi bacterium OLB7]MBK8911719.1 DNA repair protein RadA [Chlorobiota bacterium]MBX7216538.1 DNA repair protein RadA [Candidatus Kapabacteria bacterium]
MSKQRTRFVCQSCGAIASRWVGKCPSCGNWETYVEEVEAPAAPSGARGPRSATTRAEVVTLDQVSVQQEPRILTGIGEFDRVLGGGIMAGSIILVGGDPGVGKSTLMAQMCAGLKGRTILYITGEESLRQIKMRADRLGVNNPGVSLMTETNLALIVGTIRDLAPDVAIVDSIQTTYHPEIESAPGSVAQVRECTAALMQLAKTTGTSIFVVGHVTKEGTIAGPKVLEHMVDTVLQFEGERTHLYRILRTTKNRYGSTNEIGVFEMGEQGLVEVANPSSVFLSERSYGASGSVITATLEGSRPILVEAQALVTPTSYGVPQRSATGFDYKRLQMLLAVLEKRLGLGLGQYDVFVNIAGGVRVDDPAVDLAVAAAIVSSFRDVPAESEAVVIGEIGLGGEIRTVAQADQRIAEAAKLGFKTVVLPQANARKSTPRDGVELRPVAAVAFGIDAVV